MVIKRLPHLAAGRIRVRYTSPTAQGEAFVDTVTPNGLRLICPEGTELTGLVEVETVPEEPREICQVGHILWGPRPGARGEVEYGLEFCTKSAFMECILKPWRWSQRLPRNSAVSGPQQNKASRTDRWGSNPASGNIWA